MRRSIKIISLIITIVSFVALNGIMLLVDLTFEANSTVAMIVLIAMIAVFLALGVFLILRSRNKNKIKM